MMSWCAAYGFARRSASRSARWALWPRRAARYCVAAEGVVDTSQRVFGYRSFYVCDGSVITANVGSAPTLTIAALAERCMASIPPRAQAA